MIARHFLGPVFLVLCVLLGGASLAGYMANLILQLTALLILVLSFMARPHGVPTAAKNLQWLIAALIAAMVLQLIPLPPEIWTVIPGREPIARGFELWGEPLAWLPLSLAPAATIAATLWLLPAVAIVFAMIRLGAFRPILIAWSVVAVTMVSVIIGALQVSSAGEAFYFYQFTNRGLAVGPFANANHMATLLLICVPFLCAVAVRGRQQRSGRAGSGLFVACIAMLLLVGVGLVLNTSLAGIGLGVPVLVASLLLLRRRSDLPRWSFIPIALISLAAVALVFLLPIGNNLFGTGAQGSESRATSITTTLQAAADHLPFGSGYGTFAAVYRGYEDPALVTRTWMNHAHSDVAEMLLEGGVIAGLMIVIFVGWWLLRTVSIWRDLESDVFSRAATIASAAVILHSFVDYPLRTAGISAAFAACLVLMTTAREASSRRRRSQNLRHLSA